MGDAVMRAQGYAIDIERIMERVFECKRGGLAGIVNSDFIRSKPLTAVAATCGFLYATADTSKREEIENFLSETMYYLEMSLDELLSFESSTKTVGIDTTNLEYDNGEDALIDIVKKFRSLCK